MKLEDNTSLELNDDEDIGGQENQFLTFNIGEETYGLNIQCVMEIIRILNFTPIPEMSEYIKGVINLRGKIIPVMDVRLRFALPPREYDDRTCIIVVRVQELEMGLIVDSVAEVIDIPEGQIEAAPRLGKVQTQRFVKGIGKVGDTVKIILDTDCLLFEEDIEKLKEVKE